MIVEDLERCRKDLVKARIGITEAITLIMSLEGSISKGLPIEKEKLDSIFSLLTEATVTAAEVRCKFYTGE